jgi:hypothetical protein
MAGQPGRLKYGPSTYDEIDSGSDDFAALAEKIMGTSVKIKMNDSLSSTCFARQKPSKA